jgi:chromosome segregation ATPase
MPKSISKDDIRMLLNLSPEDDAQDRLRRIGYSDDEARILSELTDRVHLAERRELDAEARARDAEFAWGAQSASLASAVQTLATTERECTSFKASFQAASADRSKLSQQLSLSMRDLRDVQARAAEAHAGLRRQAERANVAEARVAELAEENRQLTNRIHELTGQLRRLESELARCKAHVVQSVLESANLYRDAIWGRRRASLADMTCSQPSDVRKWSRCSP